MIVLKFDKSKEVLTGNDYGKEVYETQVKELIDFESFNVINIPDHIKQVSIAFIQGFTEEIFRYIHTDEFTKFFELRGNPVVVKKFYQAIHY